ncbi:hydroxyacylglutathione hydrolase [Thermochromatium tepidum]|jgi:hydroxyacylglutathione hydrolase|uniref:Hydroxyacylglutathione hydrolase n=1 Tax=Thermochromatium tepidum ATCC 43061 TaxID=316276 RepID=A0A6I6E1H2_THETI|nr:hydroxyacylglutathione hydrolase [Thermochromatium tepidum]QGU33734.1 hydroxyacylglutathione hydrolase [Thermochromatium tepidum ATCC 43061]
MLEVQPIPAFEDNYIWLLTEGTGKAVVVDPGDAEPVLKRLSDERLTLTAVLITHHHYDHIGGLEDLLAAFPELEVNGPDDDRIRALTRPRREGETFAPAGLDTVFQVLEVPGHTASHIAYLGAGRLFCGDTLFGAGCGRVFDGSFEQLARSLERIAALPDETLCHCAHEYTQSNLGFATWVEPNSPALVERVRQVQFLRSSGQPTVPSRLDLERATNPFLRTREPSVIAAAERQVGRRLTTSAEVFTALRRWKDEHYD